MSLEWCSKAAEFVAQNSVGHEHFVLWQSKCKVTFEINGHIGMQMRSTGLACTRAQIMETSEFMRDYHCDKPLKVLQLETNDATRRTTTRLGVASQ